VLHAPPGRRSCAQGRWSVARAPVTGWTDHDKRIPGRRGGTDRTRAPRNRDPREAETGPLVASCRDYLALRPTSSVNDAPVAVNAIGRWGARNAQLCVMKMARGPEWRTVHNGYRVSRSGGVVAVLPCCTGRMAPPRGGAWQNVAAGAGAGRCPGLPPGARPPCAEGAKAEWLQHAAVYSGRNVPAGRLRVPPHVGSSRDPHPPAQHDDGGVARVLVLGQ
jgi:hypothetical protein